ncbi:MAG: hypothetical protein ABRQ37_25960, partial [Candidatus Eremiobacterota bacterium]
TGYDPSLKPLQFPSMKQLNPLIDETLEGIVLRAVQLDPLKRYISVTDFKETLVKYKREHCFTEYKKPSCMPNKPNKWNIMSRQFACGTLIIAVILRLMFPLFTDPTLILDETVYEIIMIIYRLLMIAMWLCPVAGLFTGLRATEEIETGRDNAIFYNIIIIIALIVSHTVFIPALLCSRRSAEWSVCEANLKNLGTALEMYSSDNNGLYPSGLNKLVEKSNEGSYMKKIPKCLVIHNYFHGKYRDCYEYAVSEDYKNFTIQCNQGHKGASMLQYPQYNHYQGLIVSW